MRAIRVLVVEDSRFFQELLVNGINMDPSMEVVAVATDPYEARDAIVRYKPDVMTLDVELPRMNGIEFLKRLMPQYAMPTVVVSALNESVFDALAAGAIEFVNKPQSGSSPEQVIQFITSELCSKIKIASTAKVRGNGADAARAADAARTQGPAKARDAAGTAESTLSRLVGTAENAVKTVSPSQYGNTVLALGASTGGTEALYNVIRDFNTDIPGIVVVQHMPPGFTKMYAERLDRQCRVHVVEAHDGDRLETGKVLIANGSEQMRLRKCDGGYYVECREGPKVSGHCPSVDVLFESVAKAAGPNAIGVILTGMGADGANGLLSMKTAGAQTIGQNEKSCVVYGMPKVAYDIGAVTYQVDLSSVTQKIYQLLAARKQK